MPNTQKVTDLAVVAQQVQTLLEGAGVDYSLNMWTANSSGDPQSSITVSKRSTKGDDGYPL